MSILDKIDTYLSECGKEKAKEGKRKLRRMIKEEDADDLFDRMADFIYNLDSSELDDDALAQREALVDELDDMLSAAGLDDDDFTGDEIEDIPAEEADEDDFVADFSEEEMDVDDYYQTEGKKQPKKKKVKEVPKKKGKK